LYSHFFRQDSGSEPLPLERFGVSVLRPSDVLKRIKP
jgi:hypothetical protein